MKEQKPIPSLEELSENIAKFQGKIAPKREPKPQGVGLAMRMGVELIAGAIVGSAVGWGLDKWLNTSPFLFIVCFFLGSAGGFLTLCRTMNSLEKEEGLDKDSDGSKQ